MCVQYLKLPIEALDLSHIRNSIGIALQRLKTKPTMPQTCGHLGICSFIFEREVTSYICHCKEL